MPEMKICPNCGKEILAVAKKCKYCGTWIEPKHEFRCLVCCEVIPEDSVICPVCHERLRPDPDPEPETIVEEPVPQPEPEQRTQPESPAKQEKPEASPAVRSEEILDANNAPSKKWLYGALAGVVALVLLAFLILRPRGVDDSPYDDAKALHEWFFEHLGTHVESLSSSPELQARLTKLLGKNAVDGIESLLSNSSFDSEPNLGLSHDDVGLDIYSLVGVRENGAKQESFIVKYMDYGESGSLYATTMLGGAHKQAEEKIEYPGMISPLVKHYEYSGKIGSGNDSRKIDMNLWVDGPGVVGNEVRGFYRERGASDKYSLQGFVVGGEIASLHLEEEESQDWFHPEFQFELPESIESVDNLKGEYLVNFGHDDDEDPDSPQGLYGIPVALTLDMADMDDGNPAFNMKYFSGKITGNGNARDIEMVLKISGEGNPDDFVSGYYRDLSKPSKRVFFKNGLIEAYHGADWTLDLITKDGNECFTLTFSWPLNGLEQVEGAWTRLKDGAPKEPGKFDKVVLNDEYGN